MKAEGNETVTNCQMCIRDSSETMELDNISELSESVNIGVGLVNTPITEMEVLMLSLIHI